MKSMCLLALLTLSAGDAAAAELPEALKPCLAMRRDSERLACFDRAAAAIEAGQADAAVTSPESLFGRMPRWRSRPVNPTANATN